MLATCVRRMRNNNLEIRIAGSSRRPQEWCEYYARCDCPWSIGVQIHWWRHRKLVSFVLFNMARGLKMFVRLFRIKASESLDKNLQQLFTKKRNGEKERKRAFYNLGQLKNA